MDHMGKFQSHFLKNNTFFPRIPQLKQGARCGIARQGDDRHMKKMEPLELFLFHNHTAV
jgi:hypothetical protein